MNKRVFLICAVADIVLVPLNSIFATVFTFIGLCITIIVTLIQYLVHIFLYDRSCQSCISGKCYEMFRKGLSVSNFKCVGYLNLFPILGPCIVTGILFHKALKDGTYNSSLKTLECKSSYGNLLYLALSETMELPLSAVFSIPSFNGDIVVC